MFLENENKGGSSMRHLLLLSAFLAVPVSAQGPAASPAAGSAQGDVSVTIYNDNLALVQDTRQLDIPAGRTRLEFPDVSAQIRPETVSFAGPDIGIVEQNFDYDLLSPGKLMEKAIGKIDDDRPDQSRDRRRDAGAGEDARDQWRRRAADRQPHRGAPRRRPAGPRDLRSGAAQSARAADPVGDGGKHEGGEAAAPLTYLTPGLGWKADYVTLFDEAAGKIDVQGWITLSNNSGTSYDECQVPSGRGLGQPG